MIRVEDLSLSYGQKQILNQLNLSVSKGSLSALLGPNGCGKTTLLKCIAGLLNPQVGNVILEDKRISDYSARQLAQKISFVRQHTNTDFEFKAYDMVMMGRNPYQHRLQNESEADRKMVERCMKQTNTWHLRDKMPHAMSGGELQRVMIARALAQDTPIMLLDEPTSNLDIAHQFEIMELLREINQNQQKTILIVVHDLNLALRYCPYSIVIKEGKVAHQGNTHDVLSAPNIKSVFGVEAILLDGNLNLFRIH